MNKSELEQAIASKAGVPASTVGEVLGAFQEVVTATVVGGGKVAWPGFLTFESSQRAARQGRNPATGEAITIAAATVPKVKIGKSFKDAVNR